MRPAKSCTELVEGVEVECTHCGVRMASHTGSGGTVRYFHCPSCQRWVTSVYTEVFRVDAKVRPRTASGEPPSAFGQVKDRLERWLRGLDANDPYRALGVDPSATDEELRERYLALARAHHPDRGGDAEAMRRLNEAYAKVQRLREGRRGPGARALDGLPSGA